MFNSLFDLLWPLTCLAGCQQLNTWFCQSCQVKLNLRLEITAYANYKLYSVADYRQPLVRKLIKSYKYDYLVTLVDFLARVWGAELLRGSRLYARSDLIIVPLPTHVRRVRERAFDHTLLLAQALFPDLVMTTDLVSRVKYTSKRSLLPDSKKKSDLRGFFACQRVVDLRHKTCLVVDDVYTTGATMSAVVDQLQQLPQPPVEIIGLVFAKGGD